MKNHLPFQLTDFLSTEALVPKLKNQPMYFRDRLNLKKKFPSYFYGVEHTVEKSHNCNN